MTSYKVNLIFSPKLGVAALWGFYPNLKTRRCLPNGSSEELIMDFQGGEVFSLSQIWYKMVGLDMIIKVKEGRIKLINFNSDWVIGGCTDDSIVWDIYTILEVWET
jgi:hypothetical protein